MDLTRLSDLAVLLALFYVGCLLFSRVRWWLRAAEPEGRSNLQCFFSGLLLWALAALHAICHLGG